MLRDSLVGSSKRCGWARKFAFRALTRTHRIGRPQCLENPRPEGAECSLTESGSSPFHAEPEHRPVHRVRIHISNALPGDLAEVTIKNKKIWEPAVEPETNRRSIYIFQRRQLEVPLLSLMDAPVLNFSCERPGVSTTAVQALTLMNDTFAFRQAIEFARRLRRETGPDAGEQIQRAYQLVFSRRPSPEEMQKASDFIRAHGRQGLDAFCRVMLNTSEFIHVN